MLTKYFQAFRREIDRRLDYASHVKHEPALCRDGIAESVAHHHRMLAVDRVTELDTVIARLSQLHPLDYIFIQFYRVFYPTLVQV